MVYARTAHVAPAVATPYPAPLVATVVQQPLQGEVLSVEPAPGSAVPAQANFCGSCGAALPSRTNFCPRCGAARL